ncbi:hypothetical protein VTK56DRAFT_9209 [Thermocarpiscus australiensis]
MRKKSEETAETCGCRIEPEGLRKFVDCWARQLEAVDRVRCRGALAAGRECGDACCFPAPTSPLPQWCFARCNTRAERKGGVRIKLRLGEDTLHFSSEPNLGNDKEETVHVACVAQRCIASEFPGQPSRDGKRRQILMAWPLALANSSRPWNAQPAPPDAPD